MKKLLFVILFLFSSFSFAFDQQAFEQADQAFMQVVKGEGDLEQAVALFEKLEADKVLKEVYLGSLLTLKGRDAWFPWSKLGYTEEGAQRIEEALEWLDEEDYQDKKIAYQGRQEWQSIVLRNIAAQTFANLPFFFNRGEDAREQLVLIQQSDKFTQSSAGLRQAIDKLAAKLDKE